MSQSYVDPTTGKALIDTPEYHQIFELLNQVYRGNGITDLLEDMAQKGDSLNWDVVSIPNFPGQEGSGRAVDVHLMMVSKQCKHPDEAFSVIQSATSDAVQTQVNKALRKAQELADQVIQGNNRNQ